MCGRFAQSQTREEYMAYLRIKPSATSHTTLSRLGVLTWRRGLKFCS